MKKLLKVLRKLLGPNEELKQLEEFEKNENISNNWLNLCQSNAFNF